MCEEFYSDHECLTRCLFHVALITVSPLYPGFPTRLKIPVVIANMFSLPLSIMLHADVSISHRFAGVGLISTLFSQAHHRLLHQKVSCTSRLVNLVTVKLIWHILRSLIASWIGNLVGACLVGLPAVYFYLSDWEAGGLLNAEEARGEKSSHTSSQDK